MDIQFRDWVAAVKAAAPFHRSASSLRVAAGRIASKPTPDARRRLADLERLVEGELLTLMQLPVDPTGKLDAARDDLEAALVQIDHVRSLISDP